MEYSRLIPIVFFVLRETYTCRLLSSQSQVVSFCERIEGKGTSVVITSSGVPSNQEVICSCNVSVVWTTTLLVTYESPGYPNCEMYIEFGERGDLFYLCKDSLNKIEVPQEFRIKYVKTTENENPAPCLLFQTDSQASVTVACYKYEPDFIARPDTTQETTSPSTSFALNPTNFTSASISQSTIQQTDLSSSKTTTSILKSSTEASSSSSSSSLSSLSSSSSSSLSSSSSSLSSSSLSIPTETTKTTTSSSSSAMLSLSSSSPLSSSPPPSSASVSKTNAIIIKSTTETTTTSSSFSTQQDSSSSKSPSTLTNMTISTSSSSLLLSSLLSTTFLSPSTSTLSPSFSSSTLTTITSERKETSKSLSPSPVTLSTSTQISSSSKKASAQTTLSNALTGFSTTTTADLTDESSLSFLSTTTFSLINLGRSTDRGISTTVIVVSAVAGVLVLILVILGVVVVTFKNRQAKAKRTFEPPNPYIDAFDSERRQSIDDNTFFNGVISTDHVNEPSKNLHSIPHNSRTNVKNLEGTDSRYTAGAQVRRENIGAAGERNMSFKTSQQTNEPGLDNDRISDIGLLKMKCNDPLYDHLTGLIENPTKSELVGNEENSPYDRIDGLTNFATKTKKMYNDSRATSEPIYAQHQSASDIHAIVKKPTQNIEVNARKLVTFKGESENDETKYRLKGILKNKYKPYEYRTGSDNYPQLSEQHGVDNISRIQMLNGDLYTTVAKTRKLSDDTTLFKSPMSCEANQENTDAEGSEQSAEYDEMTFKRHLWHWD